MVGIILNINIRSPAIDIPKVNEQNLITKNRAIHAELYKIVISTITNSNR